LLLLLLLQTESPDQTQFYCVVNTVLSLLGACLSAFACSAAFEGKLDMVHIQNATLAGGVAVGSAANLKIAPGGTLRCNKTLMKAAEVCWFQ
jgi:ammonium transporter Rh